MNEFFGTGWAFAGGAALLTMLATGWSHVRNVMHQVIGRVVVTVTVNGFQGDALQVYLRNNFAVSRWGPRAYLGWMLFVRPEDRVQLVPMEITPPSGKLYWRGWRPLWAFRAKGAGTDLEAGANARDYSAEGMSIMFLRGMFDPDELMIESTRCYNERMVGSEQEGERRHYVRHIYGTAGKTAGMMGIGRDGYSPSSNTDIRSCLQHRSFMWNFSDLGPQRLPVGSALERLALTPEIEEMVSEALRWKQSESWYRSRGLPWRRGWLLHGKPGTGKTALARAMAEDLDMPVFAYDLASLYNNELQQAWSKMLAEVPCMALIEDIDAVFDKRRNVSGRDRQDLTFDCLLNCLDGIERADGLFVVITTNRLEKIDSALGIPDGRGVSTRPGRIDRVVEVPGLNEQGRRKLASQILEEWPAYWQHAIDAGRGDTGAQFQERCARLAIALHFDEDVDLNPFAGDPMEYSIGL